MRLLWWRIASKLCILCHLQWGQSLMPAPSKWGCRIIGKLLEHLSTGWVTFWHMKMFIVCYTFPSLIPPSSPAHSINTHQHTCWYVSSFRVQIISQAKVQLLQDKQMVVWAHALASRLKAANEREREKGRKGYGQRTAETVNIDEDWRGKYHHIINDPKDYILQSCFIVTDWSKCKYS